MLIVMQHLMLILDVEFRNRGDGLFRGSCMVRRTRYDLNATPERGRCIPNVQILGGWVFEVDVTGWSSYLTFDVRFPDDRRSAKRRKEKLSFKRSQKIMSSS